MAGPFKIRPHERWSLPACLLAVSASESSNLRRRDILLSFSVGVKATATCTPRGPRTLDDIVWRVPVRVQLRVYLGVLLRRSNFCLPQVLRW